MSGEFLGTIPPPVVSPPNAAAAIAVLTQDVADANGYLDRMKRALRETKKHMRRARWSSRYRSVKFLQAKWNLPVWLAMPISGITATFIWIAACVFLAVLGSTPSVGRFLAGLVVTFVIFGGGSFWLFRGERNERGDDIMAYRESALMRAKQQVIRLNDDAKQMRASIDRGLRSLSVLQKALNEEILKEQARLQSKVHLRQVEMQRLLSIDPGRLYPDELEQYVGRVFQYLGYSISVFGGTGDQGVDVLAVKGPIRIAIQVKRYQGNVGNSAVQEVYAGMRHHGCGNCVVITSGEFTRSAFELARSTNCLLISRSQIGALVRGELGL
jgi:hypothetical protein